jgi:hypothetical protein
MKKFTLNNLAGKLEDACFCFVFFQSETQELNNSEFLQVLYFPDFQTSLHASKS